MEIYGAPIAYDWLLMKKENLEMRRKITNITDSNQPFCSGSRIISKFRNSYLLIFPVVEEFCSNSIR